MSRNKITVALIGCGRKAISTHLPILYNSQKISLKYLVEPDTSKTEYLNTEYPNCEVISDYRTLLTCEELDAVIICTHTFLHYEIGKAFLEAGKDVFTEKPVAMNYEQAKDLYEISKQNNKVLVAGVCLRFSNTLEKVRNIIQSGIIGKVYHISCRFRYSKAIPGIGSPYTDKSKSGGGVLMDLGIHYFDAIDYCMAGIDWTYAQGKCIASPIISNRKNQKNGYTTQNNIYSDVEDYVFGFACSNNSVTMNFEGSWAQNIAEEEKYIDFLGDEGAVRFYYYGGYCLWKNGKAESNMDIYDGKMYAKEFESFADDIIDRRLHSRNSVSNTLSSVKLIDMIYSSQNN